MIHHDSSWFTISHGSILIHGEYLSAIPFWETPPHSLANATVPSAGFRWLDHQSFWSETCCNLRLKYLCSAIIATSSAKAPGTVKQLRRFQTFKTENMLSVKPASLATLWDWGQGEYCTLHKVHKLSSVVVQRSDKHCDLWQLPQFKSFRKLLTN